MSDLDRLLLRLNFAMTFFVFVVMFTYFIFAAIEGATQ